MRSQVVQRRSSLRKFTFDHIIRDSDFCALKGSCSGSIGFLFGTTSSRRPAPFQLGRGISIQMQRIGGRSLTTPEERLRSG